MSNSLLPINASEFEKSLEATLCRNESINIPVDKLWNPETCPVNILPWLAWALSVDNWDSEWSEETKRAFISNSLEVHKHKGTLKAIREVLENLKIIAEITEWFEDQTTPPFLDEPHTFSLTAWVSDNLGEGSEILDGDLYRALIRAVINTKPVRSHFIFRIGVLFSSSFGLGSISNTVVYVRNSGEFTSDVSIRSDIAIPLTVDVIPYVRLS